MKKVQRKTTKKVTRKDREKITFLIKKGFVFTAKSRVCGHCDFSCSD